MFGPQGLTLDQEAILITSPVPEWNQYAQFIDPMITVLPCDGGCGETLGVSSSSRWFLEQRAQLHANLN